jgi:1-deoxy-D-xylulose-5-phosphate synthase
MTVTAPKDGAEMIGLLKTGIEWKEGPFSIRWPRDTVPAKVPVTAEIPRVDYGTWEILRNGHDLALLATGSMVLPALEAAERLILVGIDATVVNCRFIKPLDESCLRLLFPGHQTALTIEEGTVVNGFGAYVRRYIGEEWPEVRVFSMGMPDSYVQHGERPELLEELGLTPAGIAARVTYMLGIDAHRPLRESA